MKVLVASVLITSMLLLQVQPALAQAAPTPTTPPTSAASTAPAPSTPAPAPSGDVNACIEQGRNDGQHTATGGAFAIGVTSGFLLGIIGLAIAYVAQGEPEPPTVTMYNRSQDPTCRMAYADAFGSEGKKKKKSAALVGGLMGTAALVVVLVASNGSN